MDPPDDEAEVARKLARAKPGEDLTTELSLQRFLRRRGGGKLVRLGEFELDRTLGTGGFGTVFLARQTRLGRNVAIKLLHASDDRGPSFERIRAEAMALGQISHPNVVQIFDAVESERGTFIVMEYVEGVTLERWQSVTRDVDELVAIYAQAGEGLAAAHRQGILHLDFTPRNVLVGDDGRVRVVDFGLSRTYARTTADGDPARESQEGSGVTARETHGGTRGYCPPERLSREEVDERADQFSFSVALFEALNGRHPYTHEAIRAYARGERGVATLPRSLRRVSARVQRVLRRGLALDRAQRFGSMTELLEQLRPRTWHGPRVWALLGAVGAGAPLGVAAWSQADTECVAPGGPVEASWDDRRREQLSRAFEPAPHLARLHGTVVAELDARYDAWARSVAELCTGYSAALWEEPAWVGRRACVKRHREQLDRAVTMIADAGPETLEHADDVLAALRAAPGCDERSPWSSLEGRAGPLDHRELDAARLQLSAGDVDGARAAAADVVHRASEAGDAATEAEARTVLGLALAALGLHAQSVAELKEGVALAIETNQDVLVAEGWRRLLWIAAHELEEPELARDWSRQALAAVNRVGRPPLEYADYLDARGTLEALLGDEGAAEASHREALVHLEEVLAPGDPRWAETWTRLAATRARQGDQRDADAWYQRALELRMARLGPQHPEVAMAHLGLALDALEREHLDPARAHLARAEAILTDDFGPESPRLSGVLVAQAELARLEGRLDDALSIARAAWEVLRRHRRPGHQDRRAALTVLTKASLAASALEPALTYQLSLLDELSERSDDGEAVRVENNVGWLLCELDRCEEALSHYRRARDLAGDDHLLLAYADAGIGRALVATGHETEAVRTLTRARALLEAMEPRDDVQLRAEIDAAMAAARSTTRPPP